MNSEQPSLIEVPDDSEKQDVSVTHLAPKKSAKKLTLIAIVLVILLAIAGSYILLKKDTPQPANTDTNQSATMPIGDEDKKLHIYEDEVGKYSIEYPNNWGILKHETNNTEQGKTSFLSIGPKDSSLSLIFDVNYGGKGGDCMPDDGDEPHAAGNACPTSEVLKAEKTGHALVNYDRTSPTAPDFTLSSSPLFLVRIKYTGANNSDKTIFYSTIYTSREDEITTDPHMGAYLSYSVLSSYGSPEDWINIDVSMSNAGDSEAFFDRQDVKEAEAILRSFKSTRI